MDQTGQAFTFYGSDGRKWVGRIIVAVILGEAIWNLVVSIMNNVIVPWLGDFFGQSSGLPTSFTQRPYNYRFGGGVLYRRTRGGNIQLFPGASRQWKSPNASFAEGRRCAGRFTARACANSASHFAYESSSAGGKAEFDQFRASGCLSCCKPFARSCLASKPRSDSEACGSAARRSTSHVVRSESSVPCAKG